MRFLKASQILLLLLQPLVVMAQAPTTGLSLDQAVATAWEKSPVLAGMRAEVPAAEARLAGARVGGRLTASTTTFLTTGSMTNNLAGPASVMPQDILPVPSDSQADQNVMFMYPLSTGGRVSAQVAGATADVSAARAELDAALLEVAYQVRQDYWQVLLNQELVKVQERNVAEQTERLRVDTDTEAAGKIPRYYVLRDQADLADAQQELTNARRDVETALLQLKQVMGVDLAQPLALTDGLAYASAALASATELVAEALKNRPEMRAAEAKIESARRQVTLRRASYAPSVEATLMADAFTGSGVSDAGYTLGVAASIPLLNGGARSAEVSEAEALVRRAEADRSALALQISQQVRTALLNLGAADQNVKTAEASVAAAEEDYRLALLRYRAGKAINLEPTEALAALVRAQTRVAQATSDERVALDAVMKAAGRLPK